MTTKTVLTIEIEFPESRCVEYARVEVNTKTGITFSSVPARLVPPAQVVPDALLDRIEEALRRFVSGSAARRIPADETDGDLVLYDLQQVRAGKPMKWAREEFATPTEPALAVGDAVSVPRELLETVCAPRTAQGDLGLNWQIARDKAIDELRALLAAAPAANEYATNRDVQTIAELILRGEQGDLGVICSGLAQDFVSGTNTFRVRYKDGSTFQVTVRSEEVDGDEEFFVEPKPANCASNGHIFGAQKGCIFCGAEKPAEPSVEKGDSV